MIKKKIYRVCSKTYNCRGCLIGSHVGGTHNDLSSALQVFSAVEDAMLSSNPRVFVEKEVENVSFPRRERIYFFDEERKNLGSIRIYIVCITFY